MLQHPDGLSDLLWRQRESHLQYLRDLERALIEAEAADDQVAASLLEGAILHAEADLAWLDRCEERLLSPGGPLQGGKT